MAINQSFLPPRETPMPNTEVSQEMARQEQKTTNAIFSDSYVYSYIHVIKKRNQYGQKKRMYHGHHNSKNF